MLPPDALDHLPDRLVQSLESLCEEIAADMARRISKTGFLTETAVHQYTRLRELYGREVYDYVLERLREWTQYTKAELHELFEEAGEAALQYDGEIYRAAGFSPKTLADSPALLALVQAGWEKTGGLFENLVRTTAEGTQIAFIEASDRAHWQVLSGAFDYQTAIKNAVMEIADAGPIVRYPSGARAAVDVAVRRCVLTGVNQTCCKVQEARMDELGCTLVETTAHAGARPSHMVWQGRVFSRFGQTDQYEDFVTATGYGTGNGLGGWNCRHSFFPYFEGLSENAYPKEELREIESKTVFYNGEEIPLYDATQMQRKNERDIRRHKRRIAGLEAASVDKKDVQAAKAALRQAQAKQRDFCSQTGLQRDYFRERGDKQNRISPHTSLKLAKDSGIIKAKEIPFIPATSIKEAEAYARTQLGIPNVSYKGCDITTANEWNRGLKDNFDRFPELRKNFGFVGECHERNSMMKTAAKQYHLERLKRNNPSLPLALLESYADKYAEGFVQQFPIIKETYAQSFHPKNQPATAFKGVSVNGDWGKNSNIFIESLKKDVQSKFHPVNCDTIRYVLDHEVGHQLDDLLQVSHVSQIRELSATYTREELTNALSQYAWNNDNINPYSELIAEAWAEYCNNPKPRKIAKIVGEMIEMLYDIKFGNKK